MSKRGLFITFEGPDGAGKSTHARKLAELLRAMGNEVILTREPGGTKFGERVRSILLDPANGTISSRTELLMYESIRAHHVETVIRPALRRGAVVISDRFTDASMAYQGYGRGIPVSQVAALNRIATDALSPDLTVLIDINPSTGLNTIKRVRSGRSKRGGLDRIELAGRAFHQRVRGGYLRIAASQKKRILLVKRKRSPEETFAEIAKGLAARNSRLRAALDPSHTLAGR